MLALSIVPLLAAVPPGAGTNATTCRVLEAAYAEAAGAGPGGKIHPVTLVAAEHDPSSLKTWVPQYRRKLPMTEAEFAEMERRQPPPAPHYLPDCTWSGAARDYSESGVTYRASFSRPIVDDEHGLALVEVSFYSPGRFAFGKQCVVRRGGGDWTAACLGSWIT